MIPDPTPRTSSELILVADDDPFNLKLLTELCESAGYRVRTAADGPSVLDKVARERPDLVLLDVSMPGLDGFEVCRVLKSDPQLRSIAIVIVTAMQDVDARLRGLELGADDYVTKPFRLLELTQRIKTALRVRRAQSRLEEAQGRIRAMDSGEVVSPVGRYGQLRLSLEYEFVRAARYGHPLSCIAIVVDNLSEIAIRGGKEAADLRVGELVGGLMGGIRGVDLLFRFDADGFVLLLPETDAVGTEVVVHRFADAFAKGTLFPSAGDPPPKLFLGASVYPAAGISSQEALLRAAHGAVDEARSEGKTVGLAWR
jgi:PleD family two-component response regulator